jgi:hypothetical protein
MNRLLKYEGKSTVEGNFKRKIKYNNNNNHHHHHHHHKNMAVDPLPDKDREISSYTIAVAK